MIRTVAIRHVAFEDLGLLEALLRDRGADIHYLSAWDLDERRVLDADLAVFLGAPISVNDSEDYPYIAREIALAKQRIHTRQATLGICLGAQIMARAVGGTVVPGPQKEIGWAPVSLTKEGQASVLTALQGIPVLHWHGETCILPPGVESLARTPACPVQAFAPGRHALALQFHVEAGAHGIEPWLVGHAGEISATPGVSVVGLRADTARYGAALEAAAATLFKRWFDEAGLPF